MGTSVLFKTSKMKVVLIVAIIASVILVSEVTGEENCPKICPLLYGPVCGFNGKCHLQFDNECQMRMLNCNPKYSGSKFSEAKGGQICADKAEKCAIDIYNL